MSSSVVQVDRPSAAKSGRSRRRLALLCALLLACLAGAGAYWWHRWLAIRDRPFTLLLLGSDMRVDGKPSRSDTIFLLSFNPSKQTIRGLSFPRDLYVPIYGLPTNKTDRINAAFFWGQYYQLDGKETARQTFSHLLQIPVDGVVVVYFEFVRKIVDALGGVEVYCETPAYDPNFRSVLGGPAYYLRFESGWNYLDGDRALDFVRIRKPDMDFGRNLRNRELFNQLEEELQSPNNRLRVASRLPSLIGEVESSLSPLDMLRLFWAVRQMPSRDVEWFAITRRYTRFYTTPDGKSVLLLRKGTLEKARRAILGQPEPRDRPRLKNAAQAGRPPRET